MSGLLFLCATPIGNLEDVTLRVLRILGEADVIAAEDTRRTRKLLTHYDINARLISYHEGNASTQTKKIVERIEDGETVALVTDAGSPGISDPGYMLVAACIKAGVEIQAVPGPTSFVAALTVSGLPSDRFVFEGFLPRKAGGLRTRLKELADEPRTIVFFETARRILATLDVLLDLAGDRRIVVARELTKLHEQIYRGNVSEVSRQLSGSPVKGELVVVVDGAGPPEGDMDEAIGEAKRLEAAGARKSQAAAEAARKYGVSRRTVYQGLTD